MSSKVPCARTCGVSPAPQPSAMNSLYEFDSVHSAYEDVKELVHMRTSLLMQSFDNSIERVESLFMRVDCLNSRKEAMKKMKT